MRCWCCFSGRYGWRPASIWKFGSPSTPEALLCWLLLARPSPADLELMMAYTPSFRASVSCIATTSGWAALGTVLPQEIVDRGENVDFSTVSLGRDADRRTSRFCRHYDQSVYGRPPDAFYTAIAPIPWASFCWELQLEISKNFKVMRRSIRGRIRSTCGFLRFCGRPPQVDLNANAITMV